ncbi:MAG: cyclic pyranopterin monophosphate synthase MoaC [Clostridiales Family XIII bacterium]|jgi:cyclic pyranopterin phosphate synthase|nr:cyclic pyranopterin monophosphate synthase MoaC [Clostridiales Family XIII bacterium]
MGTLTHLDAAGNARMVNVTEKEKTVRSATAGARVLVNPEVLTAIEGGTSKKGDVLTVAKIAGIQAAKRTSDLIPLCHPLLITGVDVDFTVDAKAAAIDIRATVTCTGETGVEMEALTAASVAALTIYDMCKAMQRDIAITDIKLLSKSGGRSGTWLR